MGQGKCSGPRQRVHTRPCASFGTGFIDLAYVCAPLRLIIANRVPQRCAPAPPRLRLGSGLATPKRSKYAARRGNMSEHTREAFARIFRYLPNLRTRPRTACAPPTPPERENGATPPRPERPKSPRARQSNAADTAGHDARGGATLGCSWPCQELKGPAHALVLYHLSTK